MRNRWLFLFIFVFARLLSADTEEHSLLLLEAEYEGETPIFPGVRGEFVYRIYFNRDIVLMQEKLPLFPKGFRKIGEVQIKEAESQGLSVQEIRQQAEAQTPGTYLWGPAEIVGVVKESQEQLVATTRPIPIVIAPLPIHTQPASFVGAIGNQFALNVDPVSATTVQVGDPIEIQATIQGEGNLEDLLFPPLLCQPGFSGLFTVTTRPVEQSTNQKNSPSSYARRRRFWKISHPLLLLTFHQKKRNMSPSPNLISP